MMAMPRWVNKVITQARTKPVHTVLALGVLGLIGYYELQPAPSLSQIQQTRPVQLPNVGVERGVMEKKVKHNEEANAELQQKLDGQDRQIRQLQQSLERRAEDDAKRDAQQRQYLEEMVKRAQQTSKPAQTPPKKTERPKPTPPVQPIAQQVSQPLTAPKPEIHIYRSDHKSSFSGPPPPTWRADTPYLPAGSFAGAKVLTGVMATSRQGGALPVLFAVQTPFHAPFQLRGEGRNPLATALPLGGCFVFGRAQADLGSGRANTQLDTLSCVFPDGATVERPIRGYVVGEDGTLGMVGRIETHDSAVLARTFLTSLMAGAGEAFAAAKRTTVITPLGGTQQTVTGNVGEYAGFSALANAASQLSQFYLQQASQLMPVIWVESGTKATLVLQDGLQLDDFPVTTTIAYR